MFLSVKQIHSYSCNVLLLIFPLLLQAEVVFDGSLGPNAEGATLSGIFTISEDDGSVKGNNLFHSFSTFNVNSGETASFTHSSNQITNIIARVTGDIPTNINGVLNSDASLWIINPNGIMFNENASLNINGAFYATTADYLRFESDERFYAQLDQNSTLSIAEPAAFGFLDSQPAAITFDNTVLESDKDMAFIGGGIEVRHSLLTTNDGGGIFLGAFAGGEFSLSEKSSTTSSLFASSNIRLSDSTVATYGNIAGDIYIVSGNLMLSEASTIAGLSIGGEQGSVHNEHQLNIVTGQLSIEDNSSIYTTNSHLVDGNNINILAENFNIINGQLFSETNGAGVGGNINIFAANLAINGNGENTGIASFSSGSGNSGNIVITAENTNISTGGFLYSSTSGNGDSGNIIVNSNHLVVNGKNDSAFTLIGETILGGNGNSGDIMIVADTIELLDGGQIVTFTTNDNVGGNIVINARQLLIENSTVLPFMTGVSANTFSAGGASGSIDITAENMIIVRGQVSTSSFGDGSSGEINIAADSLLIDGEGTSFIGISAGASDAGAGGNILLDARQIKVLNGGVISASTSGTGDAGQIVINVDQLLVAGHGDLAGSAITAETRSDFSSAGDIEITANEIGINSGGLISTDTYQNGEGGKIQLTADYLWITGDNNLDVTTGITADTLNSGDSGSIAVSVKNIELSQNGLISATTYGSGNGGQITIDTDHLMINGKGSTVTGVRAEVAGTGDGGSIQIDANNVELLNDGNISAVTYAEGNGGKIILLAHNIYMDGQEANFAGITAASAETATGSSGDIQLVSQNIDMKNGSQISTKTYHTGDAGNISVNVQTIKLDNDSRITSSTRAQGNAGAISVVADSLALTNSSAVQSKSEANNGGEAGSITLQANLISLSNQSLITTETAANTNTKDPAMIHIIADNVLMENKSSISTQATGSKDAGNIQIDSSQTIKLWSGSNITTESEYSSGGQITLNTNNILHLSDSTITTNVSGGSGDGGNIFIDPIFIILEHSAISANAIAGDGGNITLIGDWIIQSPDSLIQASSKLGVDGNVDISAPEFDGTQVDTFTTSPLEASDFLSRRCKGDSHRSSFVVGHITENNIDQGYFSAAIPQRVMVNQGFESPYGLSNHPFSYDPSKLQAHSCLFFDLF